MQLKTWKQLKCPSRNEWLKKTWCIHTVENSSAIKHKKIMTSAATFTDLEAYHTK